MSHDMIVNRNGTRGAALMRETRAALTAMGDLEKAMGALTVHGRDYQFEGGQDAYKGDRAEYLAQLGMLLAVRVWLENRGLAIIRQGEV